MHIKDLDLNVEKMLKLIHTIRKKRHYPTLT